MRTGTDSRSSGRLRRVQRSLLRGLLASVLLGVAGIVVGVLLLIVVGSAYPFPWQRLAEWPVSPRVEDRDGHVLLELVSQDDQWRRPVLIEEMSPWIVQATIAIEDERFYSHPGIDPLSIVRAVAQNISRGEVFSGASTLTMQLCRMVDDRPRDLSAKLIDASRAIQIERRLSKRQILEQYLNLAPYGGNIRGVEAAAQRYFGKRAADLSLGEAALLAGLPQSPSRYRPDRHPQKAEVRRRSVLRRMREIGVISRDQQLKALAEPVVLVPSRSFESIPHIAWQALQRRASGARTTIDPRLQTVVEDRVANRLAALPAETDIAVVVLDVASAEVLALTGSVRRDDPIDGQVNGATARRSPGSTLKPFLYAAAFETRRLAGSSSVFDGPIERAGWRPDNFDRQYRGEISVADALRESRNVPAILVTEAVGLKQSLGVLESCGLHLPGSAEKRGGLALAVGGIEVSLLDLTSAYATLARDGISMTPRVLLDEPTVSHRALSADSCRMINDILSTRHRVPHGLEDRAEHRRPWFMWKTGTSSGRRDAWAVGHNGRLAIGVWVGRFSGAGHAAFTGREAAEPLLADLFSRNEFRSDVRSVEPTEWAVHRPLRLIPQKRSGPIIRSPTSDASYVCADEATALIPVAAEHDPGATWFLNQQPVIVSVEQSLALARGHYELRCVDSQGRSTAVRFEVE